MMTLENRLAELGRTWGLRGLAAAALAIALVGCSRQSASSTTPTSLGPSGDPAHVHGSLTAGSPNVASMLAALRASTAKYHDIEVARADGYELGYQGVVTGCISNPGVGAMGYHYFKRARMDDPSIVEGEPEVLVYHTGDDGTLVLGAVEWVVPKARWEQAGHTDPPFVFGHSLHILNPALNWYVAHAWIWTNNPGGIFVDWNPSVACP